MRFVVKNASTSTNVHDTLPVVFVERTAVARILKVLIDVLANQVL